MYDDNDRNKEQSADQQQATHAMPSQASSFASKSDRENPEDKVSDEKRSQFKKNHGQKVDFETMSQSSKADLRDRRTNHLPRDQA